MDVQFVPDKKHKKRRNRLVSIPSTGTDIGIQVEAKSLQDLFNKSLRAMAHKLKKGICSASSHSDCTMKIEIRAMDCPTLLTTFLTRVLNLTHAHRTIFCSMHIEELSENKLNAQLYGNWFDTFDHALISIADCGLVIEKENDHLWKCTISFKT